MTGNLENIEVGLEEASGEILKKAKYPAYKLNCLISNLPHRLACRLILSVTNLRLFLFSAVGLSIRWCCPSIEFLVSIFHACPRTCPPVYLCEVIMFHVITQKLQVSPLHSAIQRHFCTWATNYFHVLSSLFVARPQDPNF